MPHHRILTILLTIGAAIFWASCDEAPVQASQFSCDDVRQLNRWRARVFDNFTAAGNTANAHDPNAKNPDITLQRLRELQLELGQYFQSEPMPDCLSTAIRIYVDGARALQKDDRDLVVAMKHFQITVNRFIAEVQIAKPEWVREAEPAKN